MAETSTNVPDYPRDVSFEQVWAALKEGDQQIQEMRAEADRQMKKMRAEADRQMQELREQMKETDRKISKLGDRFGEVIEYLVKPSMLDKFRKLGFIFTKVYTHAVIKDEDGTFITETDITLEDGDKVMLIEVKSKPSMSDIKEHVERLEKARSYADLKNDKRKYLGAIAGIVFNENEKRFAFKNGFYVIEPSGDTFNILVPDGSYSPREW
jgi:hypothetical protein